jgi:cell division protein FtsA
MSHYPPIVALEIGTTKVAVAVGEKQSDGSILVTGFSREESKGVRKGEIIDVDTAQAGVRRALTAAEEGAQVDIERVCLAVSGSHIRSEHHQAAIPITSETGLITEADEVAVTELVKATHFPPDREVLHWIPLHYTIDGERVVPRAAGMEGSRLELRMLIIHGDRKRLHTPAILVRELPLEVESLAFGGLCSALGVLTPEQKKEGVLVVDLGGGTTDYLLYASSTIAHAGSLAIGGDHVTNDISYAFAVSTRSAERLKREHGAALVDMANRLQTLRIPAELGFQERTVALGALQTVIHERMDELFNLIKKRIGDHPRHEIRAGVVLTGGGAKLRHVRELAEKIFRLPCTIGVPTGLDGLTGQLDDPEFATVAGLIKYGDFLARRQEEGFWTRFWRRFASWGRRAASGPAIEENGG